MAERGMSVWDRLTDFLGFTNHEWERIDRLLLELNRPYAEALSAGMRIQSFMGRPGIAVAVNVERAEVTALFDGSSIPYTYPASWISPASSAN